MGASKRPRGGPIEPPAAKRDLGLSNDEIAALAARSLGLPSIDSSRVSRCLSGHTATIPLLDAISGVLGIPSPVIVAGSEVEAMAAAVAVAGARRRSAPLEVADAAAMAAFRRARQDIAKSYSVQKAVNPATGDVSAQSLARELVKGKPLSGDLRTIAEVASAFPKATQALKESPKAVSPLDFAFGGGASIATGNPLALATLAARPAARALQLSPMYQGLLARPQSYSQGLLEMSLPALESQYLGRAAPGLLAANLVQ